MASPWHDASCHHQARRPRLVIAAISVRAAFASTRRPRRHLLFRPLAPLGQLSGFRRRRSPALARLFLARWRIPGVRERTIAIAAVGHPGAGTRTGRGECRPVNARQPPRPQAFHGWMPRCLLGSCPPGSADVQGTDRPGRHSATHPAGLVNVSAEGFSGSDRRSRRGGPVMVTWSRVGASLASRTV